jgi:hypothetical protein
LQAAYKLVYKFVKWYNENKIEEWDCYVWFLVIGGNLNPRLEMFLLITDVQDV